MNSTAILLAAVLLLGPGSCSSDDELTPEKFRSSAGTFVEEHDIGTLTWSVDDEGQVMLLVDATSEARAAPAVDITPVKGFVTLKTEDQSAAVVLEQDPKTGLLRAKLPELEVDELNTIEYALIAEGRAAEGALHLSAEGTVQLSEARKGAKDKPGPHGGAVHVMGDDVIEVVADRNSGAVRVYVLDSNNNAVDPEEREVEIAVDGKAVEVLRLKPVEGEIYLQGEFDVQIAPQKFTVSVKHRGTRRVAVVGASPSTKIIVGRHKPIHLRFYGHYGWKVHHKGKGKGRHKKHHGDHHDGGRTDVKIKSKKDGSVDIKVKQK